MIKINNLKGTENLQGALQTVIGADYSEDEASISDFKQPLEQLN